MTRVATKFQRMVEAFRLYLEHPDGLTDEELAKRFGCDRSTIFRLRHELDGVREIRYGHFTIDPTPSHIKLAKAILKRSKA